MDEGGKDELDLAIITMDSPGLDQEAPRRVLESHHPASSSRSRGGRSSRCRGGKGQERSASSGGWEGTRGSLSRKRGAGRRCGVCRREVVCVCVYASELERKKDSWGADQWPAPAPRPSNRPSCSTKGPRFQPIPQRAPASAAHSLLGIHHLKLLAQAQAQALPSQHSFPVSLQHLKPSPPLPDMTASPPPPRILVRHLSYRFPDGSLGLRDISLDLPPRSRSLLVGANGAGKTTLLRLLAGKRLPPAGTLSLAGVDPFQDSPEGVTYLGLEWVLNPVVRSDIAVADLLRSVGGQVFPHRRDELVDVLDIDLNWRLHTVSDGERRRVQLAMGLLRPWTFLLLDEVTVDLDVLTRARFLAWLRRETEQRPCTIVYATHVLDNLATWPTHLVHMHLGAVEEWGEIDSILRHSLPPSSNAIPSGNSILGDLVLAWLTRDLHARGPRSKLKSKPEGKTYAFGHSGFGGYGDESKQSDQG